MKVIIILSIMFVFSGNVIMSQSVDHTDGGNYLKTVEYNVVFPGVTEDDNMYNLEHKSIIDRIFFGIKNSFVEFVFEDSPEGSNQATAFRIIKNRQDNSCKLEVMRLPNMLEVYDMQRALSEKTTPIPFPFWLSVAVSPEIGDRIKGHNKQASTFNHSDDWYQPYRPQPETFPLSKEFAEKLHRKTSTLIDGFKGEGIPPIIVDGYEVTFRCVVEDELWALSIHCPQGRALQLSDLFRQIIEDGFENKIDESKYLQLLD
jgi:hypothetical protein